MVVYSKRNGIKVFVSSIVHEVQNDLDCVYAILDGYGYDVLMSHKGTIPIDSRKESAFDTCLHGVDDCDVFLGFIRPRVGSGKSKEDAMSITAKEFYRAYELNKPRFVMADYRVEFAHSYSKKYSQRIGKDYHEDIVDTSLVSAECVKLYRFAILNDVGDPSCRVGNWVQPYDSGVFHGMGDVERFLEAQFKDVDRIKRLLKP